MTTLEGNALRRAVAEEQGYSIVYMQSDEPHCWLVDQNGKQCAFLGYLTEDTDEDALWLRIMQTYLIRDYAHDLNTIKDAPLPDNMRIDCFPPLPDDEAKRWGFTIRPVYSLVESYSAAHPKPATAFWNAWLEMRKGISDERKEN